MTTQPDKNAPGAENKLAAAKRQGEIEEPNRAWVDDVVYVATKQEKWISSHTSRWLYSASSRLGPGTLRVAI